MKRTGRISFLTLAIYENYFEECIFLAIVWFLIIRKDGLHVNLVFGTSAKKGSCSRLQSFILGAPGITVGKAKGWRVAQARNAASPEKAQVGH